ncbi:MAG: tyrosine-type recombinase/integrase [gamma proteobacterium symbiont of Taylorina sp.]|nr:tyrosine-type recombinase/integrase [gamma proteobacterium symbiont of Taylorina sp.]
MSPYVDEPFEFRKQWYKARDNTDIDKSFVFHSLRHTAASNLAKAGQSLLQIGVILGHKSTQTTLRYSHLVERNTLYDITHEAMAHLG